MQTQQSKPLKPEPPAQERIELAKTKDVKAVDISETIAKAKKATKVAKQAIKQKQKRTHRCRICGKRPCPCEERVWDDTGEEFNLPFGTKAEDMK